MTTTLADPLAGLRELLERLAAERGGFQGLLPGLTADPGEGGWTPVAELTRPPYDLLAGLIDQISVVREAPRHVRAALMWKTYAYWHSMPVALGWALNRRVPLMPFAETVYRASDTGITIAATSVTTAVLPGDPLAGAPGTVVVHDLGAAIRETLLTSQLPLIKAIGGLTKIGARNLWGSTAESLVYPLRTFADALPPGGGPADLLAAVGDPVGGLIDFTADGYRRRTCCLWVTLPDTEPCATCCVSASSAKNT
ncbi:hypothetical protein DP939_25750 [Spongiactinospora rosea]|uniref:(2Fe-2S)-binding protein n=1 Tax=Spongiactinospora rosea TaxID=2248750 RepID=A0A366LUS0_9ACTN|nr:hypothetical protein [Spongiactinospora rosea]RBQ17340.1 hypothetical protein DP939_25750 [Spongiactinospora rosea]